jgi:hypothetical protein
MSELLGEPPKQWNLRGDPYLWQELIQRFEGVPCPDTVEGVRVLLEEAFRELTGVPLSHPETVYVQRLAHGGMSSGCILPEFWRETVVPLLLGRFQ